MLDERMEELNKICEMALYEEVQLREDGKAIVRDNASGKLFYRKRLTIYNPEVFEWLRTHKSSYVPEIEYCWQDEDDLIVIEEFIQGKTLDVILEETGEGEGLPFQERIRILTEVCNGLLFLHGADPPIIHRDLKPSNIMLTEEGQVKIIDYDAAKLYVRGQKRDTQLIGTQGMAAPEQYGFAASDIRTDIYALGKLIEIMLPGNPDAARIAERATNLDPARRYSSAVQIREQIQRIHENPSGLDRLLKRLPGYDPAKRNHYFTARICLFLLCLCACLFTFFFYRQHIVIPRERQKILTDALKTLSEGQSDPEEIFGMSQKLLQQMPYDKMNSEGRTQFRKIAETVICGCISAESGHEQVTGLFLSEEGEGYLDLLRESGVDEETVKEISLNGQIQYFIQEDRWDRALESMEGLRGMPNEEQDRAGILRVCTETAEQYVQDFSEQPTSANAASAFVFYTQIMHGGIDDAEMRLKDFYALALSSAEKQSEEGEYESAEKLYQVLLEYKKDVPLDDLEPSLGDKILENCYLKAQAEMDAGDYDRGRADFLKIENYKNAAMLANECAYLKAQELASDKEYEQASVLFSEISGYKDADEKGLSAKFNYCELVSERPTDSSYRYIEELIKADYPGAARLKEVMYAWHAEIDTGVDYLVGSEQSALVRATLYGGPSEGNTHIRFELIDLESKNTYNWTSEEKYGRGESCTAYYQVNSIAENIFEKEHTVNIYVDDGTQVGSWTGCFSMNFLEN